MSDHEKEGRGVGRHLKFILIKTSKERNISIRAGHGGDGADVGSVVQFKPHHVSGKTAEVGAQQCDVFARLNLHRVKLTNGDRDPA